MSSSEYECSDEADSDDDRKGNEQLFQAIRDNEYDKFRQLLKRAKGTNIIDKNNKGHTLLHYAVDRNRKEIVKELLRLEWKIDINAQNEDGDTALHVAYSRGRKELIELLQKADAKTNIKNNKGKSASECKKKQKNTVPSAQSQAGPSGLCASGHQQQSEKRKEFDFDDAPSKKLRFLREMKRPSNIKSESEDYQMKKLKTSEEYQASGLKSSLHGVAYQLKLLMLFLRRGVDRGYSFRLATEMDAAEKFDDLVFQYAGEHDNIFHSFLQAKHKQDKPGRETSENISISDLLTATDGNFSLQKYFISYRKIKTKPEFNGANNEIGDLIICTNIGFASNDKRGTLTLSNDIFDKEKDDSILKTELFRFKKDFVGKEEIISALKNAPDLVKLAKKLTECVLDGKSIDNNESKSDESDKLVKLYRIPLVREVIDTKNKKLHPQFVTNDVSLSTGAKNLRTAFEELGYYDRRTLYNLDSDRTMTNENLENLVQELVALIVKDKGSKKIKVAKRKNEAIKKNLHKLAGYILVKDNGAIRFSSTFLNSNKLPGNLDRFRKRFSDELSKNKIPFNTLVGYKFEVYKDFQTCEEMYTDKANFWRGIREKTLQLLDNFGESPEDAKLESMETFVKNFHLHIQESASTVEKTVKIIRKDMKFSKNINKLAEHALIEKNGEIRFSREFLENDLLPGNLNDFRSQLKNKIDSIETDKVKYLSELRFIITNFPKFNLPIDSVASMKDDIEAFLDKLRFAVNYPNEIELDGIIKAELSDCKNINLIGSDIPAGHFEKFMFDWMKGKKGFFLTHDDGKKFFKEMNDQLVSMKLTGFTLKYQSQMKQTNIRFVNVEKKLQEFLKQNKMQVLILTSLPNTILGSIKLYEILHLKIDESMKNTFEKDDSYIYMHSNSFLRMQDRVADAFNSRSEHLLIIECKPIDVKTVQLYERLINETKSNGSRKIILITEEENNKLANEFKVAFSDRYVQRKIEVNGLIDLTNESQDEILKREVLFQEKNVKLRDLMSKDSIDLINAEALSRLINNEMLQIAEPLQDLGVVREYYIPRKFNRWDKINRSFRHDKSRFFLPSNCLFEHSNLLQNQDIVLISHNDERFKQLIDNKKYKRYNIHWLKSENGKYIWQESNGALSKLRDLVDKSKETVTTYTPTKLNDLPNKIVIIAAEPGMGKSTVLTNLAAETKASQPTLWVARINLSIDCSRKLQTLVDAGIRFDEKNLIDFLFETMKLKPGFEQEFFKNCYRRGKIALLFDGFDEISPDYTDKVVEMLKYLIGTKVEKIWITTRPYNIKNNLEDELGVFSCVLEEFSKDDQRRFLKEFWAANLQLDNFDEQCAEVFIDKLLGSFSKLINDRDRKFISIPLQIRMVAEVCKNTFAEFCKSVNYELSNDQKQKLEQNLDLISLYENFFKIKFDDICFGEKKPEWNGAVADTKRIQNRERKFVIEDHKKLALLNLYSNNWVEKLLSGVRNTDLLKDVQRSENKTGIIDRVVDGKPVFVHQSFAEYFAALWFAEKLHDEEKQNIVKEFLKEHIFRDESKVIRNFLDRMLTKDDSNCDKYEIHVAVLNNNVDEVRRLLVSDASVLDTPDKVGRTPLHLAAAYGHIEIAQILLQAAQKYRDLNILCIRDNLFDWSPLSYADKNNHWDVVELLLKMGANGDDMFETLRSNSKGYISRHKEVENQNEIINRMVAEKANAKIVRFFVTRITNFRNQLKAMPLHNAVWRGHLEIVKYLVGRKNADFEAVNEAGETPLHNAVWQGHLGIIKYLVDEKNADVEARNRKERTLLHKAAMRGNLEIVKYLVDEKKLNCEAVDDEGKTPLHNAALQGHLEIIKYLVNEKNSNFEIIDAEGKTPLHNAAWFGHLEILEYLIDEKNANLKAVEAGGRTLLHSATWGGHLEIVKYLVDEKNANVNAVEAEGKTPLHNSAWHGHLEIMKYLLDEKNANFEAVDAEGKTSLHIGVHQGHLEIIKYLINGKNANFEAIDAEGKTPLHIAVHQGHLEIIKYLIDEKNANFEVVDARRKTPLHIATYQGYLEIIIYLVNDKNADLEAVDAQGETPLHIAAYSGHLEIVKYLVDEKNANVVARNHKGETPLNSAAHQGHLEIIEYLVDEKHADFEAVDANGKTPLHNAAQGGHLEVIKFLVDEKNANFEAVDSNQRTLLHIAAWQGHLEVIKYLVDVKNANTDALNQKGETPLHMAVQQGHLEIIKYLSNEKKI